LSFSFPETPFLFFTKRERYPAMRLIPYELFVSDSVERFYIHKNNILREPGARIAVGGGALYVVGFRGW